MGKLSLSQTFFNPLYDRLKNVLRYRRNTGASEDVTEARNVETVQQALFNIIGAYESDFAKHDALIFAYQTQSQKYKSVTDIIRQIDKI